MQDMIIPFNQKFEWLIRSCVVGGGILIILSLVMMIYGVKLKKGKRYFCCWSMALIVSIFCVVVGFIFGMSGRYMA